MQLILLIIILIIGVITFIYKGKTTTKNISVSAILLVLSVVLNLFSLTIPIIGFPGLKIGFSSIPLIFIGVLTNPFTSFIAAIGVDILGLLFNRVDVPFLGFTLNNVLIVVISNFIYNKVKIFSKYKITELTCLFAVIYLSFNIIFNVFSDTESIVNNIFYLALLVIFLVFIFFSFRFVNIKYSNNEKFRNNLYFSLSISLLLNIFVYMILNPIWLNYVYGIPIGLSVLLRTIKAVILIPLFTLIIYKLLKFVN